MKIDTKIDTATKSKPVEFSTMLSNPGIYTTLSDDGYIVVLGQQEALYINKGICEYVDHDAWTNTKFTKTKAEISIKFTS